MRVQPPIQQSDIEHSHRVGQKDKDGIHRNRSIIIRFKSEHTRDSVYRARFQLKHYNTVYSDSPVFVNEDLTAHRASFASATRRMKKEKRITDTWTASGKIVVKSLQNVIAEREQLAMLVTGGASGLGLATVRRFAAAGVKVVICDLPASRGSQIADELGDGVVFVPTDVRSESDVEQALKITKEEFGALHVVVNCAAVAIGHPVYDADNDKMHSLEEFRRVLDVNATGTFNVTRLAVRMMSCNKPNSDGQRGIVINVSSVQVTSPSPLACAYVASKGAISGMTLCLARDLARFGIRCVAIAPGVMDTPMACDHDKRVYPTISPSPQRVGRPDEFAHLVQCVIENPFINAGVIGLDAGLRTNFTNF